MPQPLFLARNAGEHRFLFYCEETKMKSTVRFSLFACALLVAAFACVAQEDRAANPKPDDEKADRWNYRNNPERLNVDLNYKLDELPTSGRSEHIPWPATYWPTYEDSTNVRWGGDEQLSPVEKYDLAFNSWEPDARFFELKPYNSSRCDDKSWDPEYYEQLGPAAKYISAYKGNAKARNGIDDDDDGETDECGDRDGVETWWGLCHAWVPAAMLEDEPQKKVEYNGVEFEVSDLKALLIGQYDRTSAVMVGGRCNDKEVERDDNGRITDPSCRDTNAGTWHVAMANFLGIMKRSIAEDRTYNYEVWNQPVIEWKVKSLETITEAGAIEALGLGADVTEYPYNDDAKGFALVSSISYYITESQASTKPYTEEIATFTRQDHYDYILELDGEGNIIGGEWIGTSITNHPDFLWLPLKATSGNPHVDMDKVKMLIELSRTSGEVSEGATPELRSYEQGAELSIPDNAPAGVVSTIVVPDNGTIAALSVDVMVEHSYIGDLKIVLRKAGREVILHDQTGGSTDDIVKTYEVSEFVGEDAAGTWELFISDNYNVDLGTLVSWGLKVRVGQAGEISVPQVINAANDVLASIPDNDEAGVSSTIMVAEDVVVRGLKVKVNIEHSWIGALVVELRHGAVVHTLHALEGASGTKIDKTYEVSGFDGSTTTGAWTLVVKDNDAYGDTGNIVNWSLEIRH
jgi:subtilisin-like proprotein convertase family protein